jgi:hypothetical protein
MLVVQCDAQARGVTIPMQFCADNPATYASCLFTGYISRPELGQQGIVEVVHFVVCLD